MNVIYFCKKTIEDTKGVTRSIKLKDRQCNCQKKKDNNDIHTVHRLLQNEQHEPLKTGTEHRCSGTIPKTTVLPFK